MTPPDERPQLLLWGFMGAGKSTTGRIVAARRGVAFVDLDERIAADEEASVAEIFAMRGEAAFRALEARHLAELLDRPAARVVALGGGTLLDASLRARALTEAFVVVLDVDRDSALARVSVAERPLLGGDSAGESADSPSANNPARRAARLLAARASAYCAAHHFVDARRRIPEVVADLDAAWKHHS
jgi:shikimate kinase / 3-dehydroquinate synthase